MAHAFITPTRSQPYARDRFWGRFNFQRGVQLLKIDGLYHEYADMLEDELLQTADVVYLGGHSYVVSDQEALDLIAAGYGSGLVDYIVPVDGGYGSGPYGDGPYGDVDGRPFGRGLFGAGSFGVN